MPGPSRRLRRPSSCIRSSLAHPGRPRCGVKPRFMLRLAPPLRHDWHQRGLAQRHSADGGTASGAAHDRRRARAHRFDRATCARRLFRTGYLRLSRTALTFHRCVRKGRSGDAVVEIVLWDDSDVRRIVFEDADWWCFSQRICSERSRVRRRRGIAVSFIRADHRRSRG